MTDLNNNEITNNLIENKRLKERLKNYENKMNDLVY